MSKLIDSALRLAVIAHEGQLRKESPTPYITHPVAVALLLASYQFPEEVLAAALTHDVLEDTPVSNEELKEAIGDKAYAIVLAVTNDDTLAWEDKKRAYVESVRNGPEGSFAVAIADKIHNLESLLAAYHEQGTTVWEHFNAGMEKKLWFENLMLATAQQHWNHPLVERYAILLKELEDAIAKP